MPIRSVACPDCPGVLGLVRELASNASWPQLFRIHWNCLKTYKVVLSACKTKVYLPSLECNTSVSRWGDASLNRILGQWVLDSPWHSCVNRTFLVVELGSILCACCQVLRANTVIPTMKSELYNHISCWEMKSGFCLSLQHGRSQFLAFAHDGADLIFYQPYLPESQCPFSPTSFWARLVKIHQGSGFMMHRARFLAIAISPTTKRLSLDPVRLRYLYAFGYWRNPDHGTELTELTELTVYFWNLGGLFSGPADFAEVAMYVWISGAQFFSETSGEPFDHLWSEVPLRSSVLWIPFVFAQRLGK